VVETNVDIIEYLKKMAENNSIDKRIRAQKLLKNAQKIISNLEDDDRIPDWADGVAFNIILMKAPVKKSKYNEDEFYSKTNWAGFSCRISQQTYLKALKAYIESGKSWFILTRNGKLYSVSVSGSAKYDVYKLGEEVPF